MKKEDLVFVDTFLANLLAGALLSGRDYSTQMPYVHHQVHVALACRATVLEKLNPTPEPVQEEMPLDGQVTSERTSTGIPVQAILDAAISFKGKRMTCTELFYFLYPKHTSPTINQLKDIAIVLRRANYTQTRSAGKDLFVL